MQKFNQFITESYKKGTKAIAKDDSEMWGTTKGRVGIITKSYFWNGESHIEGKWEDTGEKFDLPDVFFTIESD